MLRRLGPELSILETVPVEEIRRHSSLRMAEAIQRLRRGEVIRSGGYDGEFGVIRVFQTEGIPKSKPPAELFVPGSIETRERSKSVPARKKGPEPVLPGESGVSVPDVAILVSADGLDPDQDAAASHGAGPLVILAGPGTGKTRTLTRRLARSIRAGAVPESTLAVTFTRRAAEELRERLTELLGEETAKRIPVLTFHALGWWIIRQYADRSGYAAGKVAIASEEEALGRLREDLNLSRGEAARQLQNFSGWRRGMKREDGALSTALLFHREAMRRRGVVELEDLVALPVQWLDGAPEWVEELRNRFAQVFVDEFQDIDATQYALLRHLVPRNGNLTVIGDPDQSIYGFRGGDPGFFVRLLEDHPNAKSVRLTRNYRSGQAIVAGALEVMARSVEVRERGLTPILRDARRIVLHTAASDQAEAAFVAQTLEAMMGGHGFHAMQTGSVDGHATGEYAFADFAVLCRAEALTVPLCQALERAGIPYQKRSHERLRDHPGVRLLVEAMERLTANGTVVERLRQAVVLAGEELPEVATALEWLTPLALGHGEDGPGFVAAITLGAEVDLLDPRAQRVSLLTMHGSKGLEYRVVFVIGCEEGMLPWRFGAADPDPGAVEEERRLLFVAMTRARETLFLSWSRKRLWRGAVRSMEMSSFLQDIREELLDRRATRTSVPKKHTAAGKQLSFGWD
ncbi:MAG: ATP-dependent helicase [Magnetococcales bacterium]|nr:ATP-dependent helicase [Magnetococcales bacterium]